jgi:hypothetical protein
LPVSKLEEVGAVQREKLESKNEFQEGLQYGITKNAIVNTLSETGAVLREKLAAKNCFNQDRQYSTEEA